MLPIGPLMIEHRLIERMIQVMRKELQRFEKERKADPIFVDMAVDFIRTYADRCHHGKEEDILFRELSKKQLVDEHKRIMDELIEEHRWGRKTVGELVDAKEKYATGDNDQLTTILDRMSALVDFYPKHIEKEDKRFFLPCMEYFNEQEKGSMLSEGWEFDRRLIHEKYENVVVNAEESLQAPNK